jgi:hypothetical protein
MERKNAQPLFLTAAVVAAIAAAAPATAAAAPRITASPKTVQRAAVQTVRGFDWPLIEFCSRTIRVSVRSAQNAVPIAQRHTQDDGTFRFRWTPKNRNIGRGDWTLVARMRCESGKDGSTILLTRRTRITIN